MTEVAQHDEVVQSWLSTPLGASLLSEEARVVETALDGIFGEQCVQLGLWGDARTFLRFARTQHACLIDEGSAAGPAAGTAAVGQLHRLPIASDCVDSILLPHVLDYSDRPHAILREVHRVLRADGHLLLLGFKPGGLWGLRRRVPGAGLPPGAGEFISDRRLSDWLQLLDMRIHGVTRYFFRWPLPGTRSGHSPRWESRGRRWWPELAACYMLTAQKRVSTLTPVRPLWSRKPRVVTGLAEPSARASRLSKQT